VGRGKGRGGGGGGEILLESPFYRLDSEDVVAANFVHRREVIVWPTPASRGRRREDVTSSSSSPSRCVSWRNMSGFALRLAVCRLF
jgi:hypothetical protein